MIVQAQFRLRLFIVNIKEYTFSSFFGQKVYAIYFSAFFRHEKYIIGGTRQSGWLSDCPAFADFLVDGTHLGVFAAVPGLSDVLALVVLDHVHKVGCYAV